jgi:DNA modification methylase
MINLYHIDCMEFMADKPDKYYDLAIVDPPYGIGIGTSTGGQNHLVKVGGANVCLPKFIGGLMIPNPHKKNTLTN